MKNSGQSLLWNMDGYIRRWRNVKTHWFGRHLRCHHLFSYWNFHIPNNQDQHHPLLWSPHSILRNHLWPLLALQNILRTQHHWILPPNWLTLPTSHCFLSCRLWHFKFLPLIISWPRHYWHHPEPIYIAGSSSDDLDRSPRSSALSLQITNWWWAQWTPYEQEGCTLQEMQVGTPFGGHLSTLDLESLN